MNEDRLAEFGIAVVTILVVSLVVVVATQPAHAREVEPDWTWKVAPSDRTNTGALLRIKMDEIEQRIAEIIAEYEAEQAAIEAEQAAWEAEQAYYEPVYYDYTPSYSGGYNNDFQQQGVVYDGETTYSWYSQRVLPGGGLTELNNNGRTVNSDGFVVDGDGYIAVAQPGTTNPEIGMVIETPFGLGKVYDSNPSGDSWDIYTDF